MRNRLATLGLLVSRAFLFHHLVLRRSLAAFFTMTEHSASWLNELDEEIGCVDGEAGPSTGPFEGRLVRAQATVGPSSTHMREAGPGFVTSAFEPPPEIAGQASPPHAWAPQLSDDSREERACHFDAPIDWPWSGTREVACISPQWPPPAHLRLLAHPQGPCSTELCQINQRGYGDGHEARIQVPEPFASAAADPVSQSKRPRLRNRSTAV